jgi:dihydroxyacetone kinase
MTYLFNAPTAFKEEMIEGYTAAYSRYLERVPNASAVRALNAPKKGKVSIIIGGGAGHYPAFCGLVGCGMADGAVIGDVFASPGAEQVYRCTKAVDGGAGVVYVCVNYSGDVMNFGMAADRSRAEGIDVRMTLITDDVASAPPDQVEDRRGIAGGLYVIKAAGASAARGDDVNTVESIARHANDMTRSFGIAFAGCTIPGQPGPLFSVEPKQMEVGLGIHGEPGIRSAPLLPACELAQLMVDTLLANAPKGAGNRVAVLLNGLGSTKYEELFVLYGTIHGLLKSAGLDLYQPLIAEAVTSLDMAGCSLSLMWLDGELENLLNAPASTPAYTKIGENGHV